MSSLNYAFGTVVQRIRKEKGISQWGMETDFGISRKYLSDVENGKRNVSLDFMEKISEALDMSLQEIFDCVITEKEKWDNLE